MMVSNNIRCSDCWGGVNKALCSGKYDLGEGLDNVGAQFALNAPLNALSREKYVAVCSTQNITPMSQIVFPYCRKGNEIPSQIVKPPL
jgi:hypothetical protein